MAINKTLLKNDINDCFLNFKNYFDLTFELNSKVLSFWENLSDKEIYSEIKKLEVQSNDLFKNLSNEVSWNISKHLPAATNLRFFLAVLISLKDLERYADYGLSIARILKKHGKVLKVLLDDFYLFRKMLKFSKDIWNLVTETNGKIKNSEFQKGLEIKNNFRSIHQQFSEKINLLSLQLISLQLQNSSIKETDHYALTSVNLILVKTDRSLDHVFNVLENFYQIYNPNLENEIILKED